jgi:PPK2 family polyphosphate:nucleotide phosphotransferase
MKKYRVSENEKIDLNRWDPDDTSEFKGDKGKAEEAILSLTNELDQLQDIFYADSRHKLLIVLQGTDTGGKDGIIRHVFEGVDPLGVRVASFKTPSYEELNHDYLWRIHKQLPGNGEIVIFNRSHYEDVLIVRVHNLVPPETWSKRYDQINQFEKMLTEEGTTILKFFLFISKEEQRTRLVDRLNDPTKQWKFNLGDLKERELWGQYIEAYGAMLEKTSTEWAPWYIVPSNHKWYRNLVVGSVIVDTLKRMDLKYPQPIQDIGSIVIK